MTHMQKGFSLTEVLISLAITSMIGIGIATFLGNQGRSVDELKHSYEMYSRAATIEAAAGRPEVLLTSAKYAAFLASANGNQELANCILPNAGGPCTATDPERPLGFALIEPLAAGETPSKGTIARRTLAAGSFTPGRLSTEARAEAISYTLRGKHCGHVLPTSKPSLRKACQVRAFAMFWATCPAEAENDAEAVVMDADNNAEVVAVENRLARAQRTSKPSPLQCQMAETIHIRYIVVHDPEETKTAKRQQRRLLGSVPELGRFKYTNIAVPVASLPEEKTYLGACLPNETAVSVANGKYKCECLYPFQKITDITGAGVIVCAAVSSPCAKNERLRGVFKYDPRKGAQTFCKNTDGSGGKVFDERKNGSPICCRVVCEEKPFNPLAASGTLQNPCPAGAWLESVTSAPSGAQAGQGACHADFCVVGKDGGPCTVAVNCSGTISCCHEPTSSR